MIYAMLYAENADVIGTYESEQSAVRDLVEFINSNPGLQDEVGLRPYENGRPAGSFRYASELLRDRLAQQQFIDA